MKTKDNTVKKEWILTFFLFVILYFLDEVYAKVIASLQRQLHLKQTLLFELFMRLFFASLLEYNKQRFAIGLEKRILCSMDASFYIFFVHSKFTSEACDVGK
jgi:hypothetical protein